MLINLDFVANIILSSFFYFFLINDIYFLILAAIAQILNPLVEPVILIGIPSKDAKAEIELYPVMVEAKIRKSSI